MRPNNDAPSYTTFRLAIAFLFSGTNILIKSCPIKTVGHWPTFFNAFFGVKHPLFMDNILVIEGDMTISWHINLKCHLMASEKCGFRRQFD